MSASTRIVRSGLGEARVILEDGGTVRVGDTALRVSQGRDGTWRAIDPEGRSSLVHVAHSPDGAWVHLDGRVFLFDVGTAARPASRAAAADAALSAPMPATVLAVVAPAGTAVEEGEVLLLLEAMKMELPIRAPRAGTVSAVRCREGELVQPGVTLVDLA